MSGNDNDNSDSIGGFSSITEYNNYVITDGIWAKIEAKTNIGVLDWFNTRARKMIRERGGILTTRQAIKLMLDGDRQELINEISNDIESHGHPVLADAFRDAKTRSEAVKAIESMLKDMESPD